ncbi:Spore maturation protein SpmA [Catalinimonas alkaloidigena]|uniref:Spore maturation protein SpmA n=1 Tax=Catalinimonas alkaloidigena TaxID=1075417 RepID=A0A1G9RRD9_9BACT|nr:spore maturation protein [Catalinimonas alkaloidigena]SDM25650.1 Spore maturation protein SpmA [Catalinimonas alkaloidigena]
MVLNYIWIAFFLIAFVVGLIRLIFLGDAEVFPNMVSATFDMAKTGFEISLGLTGVLTLWLGLMKIGEAGGMIRILAKLIGPLFHRLFPEVPAGHPVFGSILMNFSANMLGLDNAATPLGLKAMEELQELNPTPETASNAQIMFLVLNTSGLTLIPISIMTYRAELGAANPADIFIPILLTTFFSTMAGLIAVSLYQRINLFHPVVLAYLGGLSLFIAGIIWYFATLDSGAINRVSTIVGNLILFTIIAAFIGLAWRKGINVYDTFIEGAKEGFQVAVKIIPYLVAVLVAIGVFRACGALDYIQNGLAAFFGSLGVDTRFVAALPTALMKPLSGSGARGLMVDLMQAEGADSFAGRLVSTIQGATDTTFYILAVYFGSVNIRNTRYAVTCGLIADFAAIISGIFIAYLFFG